MSQTPSPSPTPSPAGQRRWRRGGLIFIAVIAASVLALALAMLVVSLLDWNRARPWINEKVSVSTGRHFAIQGNLAAQWQWPQPFMAGWQRWVPGLTVHAEQLVLGNRPDFGAQGALQSVQVSAAAADPDPKTMPETAAATDAPALLMATVRQASASLHLLPLLHRTLALDTVALTGADVSLVRLADGRNNWTFVPRNQPQNTPNPWGVTLEQLQVNDSALAYADATKDLWLRARVTTLSPGSAGTDAQGRRYGIGFDIEGRLAKAKIEGSGQAGDLLLLRNKVLQYPVQLTARAGETQVQATGTLANPRALSGMDLQVVLKGASMGDLHDLTGLVLPHTPPYTTQGRLVGSLTPQQAQWDYQDFHGTVGESDLHGHLTYTSRQPRPQLTGKMHSNQLRLVDLGPVLGAAPPAPSSGKKQRPSGKVLPSKTFATQNWKGMDVDIAFEGRKIVRSDHLPIHNLSTHAVLENAQLRLSPLRFGVAQGKIDAQVVLDSRQAPLQAQVRATIEGLELSALFPKVQLMKKSLGRMDGALALSGQGNSVASLLGSSTGEARLYVREGTLSKQLLELAALNVGSIIVGKLFGETREVHLRCAVADLSVKDGIAQTRTVKLSTQEAIVEAVGTLNMAREHIDLRIKPESLEWKFFSLRTPLYVRGPFAQPDVGIEPGQLLLRAGAAVAAAAIAPAALALVPITVPGADDDAHCAKLLAQATAAVQAGPAGAKPKAAQR
ncbi:MAG: AsmA family protein [Simplicispira sp.]|nr:AsmA family protein [Simplicispira sp.]